MRTADLIRLLTLAAIWGASFLFIRIVAPVLGPFWTAEVRVTLAGIAMVIFLAATGKPLQWRTHWKPYLILGTLNSAAPFALFSYAGMTLPAGYSAILNATTPLWGALIGALLLGETLTLRKLAGLACGIAGVAFLVRLGPAAFTPQLLLAALACIAAAVCYGFAGAYTKKVSVQIAPPMMATGSQLGATLVLLPFLAASPVRGTVTLQVAACAVALALLCSAVAYFIYFRLIADLGPTKALTVTFLIPLFALLWGTLFLGETIDLSMVIGCAMVVLATWLVVFQPQKKAG
ncbi:EamA/RhaT family transporter [Oxalobacteraceae bacterium OM1]|nr:EamA/RhaT family transporter [Oxalobacteraceae bacterium OM1]